MLSRWPIRYKLLLGVAILFLIVATLSVSGFRGVYAYRQLARSISERALELPEAAKLTRSVDQLRFSFTALYRTAEFSAETGYESLVREEFRNNLLSVHEALRRYEQLLDRENRFADKHIGDNRLERQAVGEIQTALARIDELNQDEDWVFKRVQTEMMAEELDALHKLAGELPSFLQERMYALQGAVKLEYRTLIVLSWVTTILTVAMLLFLVKFFQISIFRPLQVLIDGSRRVAAGQFSHRIHLPTHDEVADLAGAMNAMTSRFQEIRDDLDRQVKERTREVVRSEQLASVGFLAAGVAHEINNPLASIAWCAESLESRIHDILRDLNQGDSDVDVLRTYLRRIQDEAFRCKGITEQLLDFSRLGGVEKNATDLRELTEGVIEMVRHLGNYRGKTIRCECGERVTAAVNSQEIKQVVLNLITNALDSIDRDGTVQVVLRRVADEAELTVRDDGCGMTDEVLEHLFEPFFTRRRHGQGTGLGLSITYRIVTEHGGKIEAFSDGPGRGSRFRVTLPISQDEQDHEENRQAA